MLSNIVLVISLLFFLVEGAKYKVVSNDNLRSKLSKEDKIKAVTQLKEHIASVTGKASKKDSSVLKRIQAAKQLESWNAYNTTFSSTMWTNVNKYKAADCVGSVVSAYATYESICNVGLFEGSDGVNYYSERKLFTSDCALETAAFYITDDCSGTPAKQGNTVSTGRTISGGDVCGISGDNDDESSNFLSETVSCTSENAVFLWGALQTKEYAQTTTCQGDFFHISYIMGGCYQTSNGGSIYYAKGQYPINAYFTADCTGPSDSINYAGCMVDDTNTNTNTTDVAVVDDEMFNNSYINANTSAVYAWSGSSMGAVLNYSLSAALVLMSCTLFF